MYQIEDFLKTSAVGDASFSPDGSHIAYLNNESGITQAYLMAADGGNPEQLTRSADPVSFIRFSPTRDQVVYGTAAGGNERTQLFLLDLETRETTQLTHAPEFRHDFGDWSPDSSQISFVSNERNGTDFDAYVLDIASLERTRVLELGGWCSVEAFSPSGSYLVVSQNHSNEDTDLYLCDLRAGTHAHLTPHEGRVFHSGAAWLPDESAFFLITDRDREFNGLAKYTLAADSIEYVLTPDADILRFAIDWQGARLAITTNEEGYARTAFYDPCTLAALSHSMPEGFIYRLRFSADGTKAVFGRGDARSAQNIWALDFLSDTLAPLTFNPQGVPAEVMVEPTLVRFDSFDGLSVPAFVFRPKNAPSDVQLPVLITIHGGPESQYLPTYDPLAQYLVHRGYVVVAPNVRGSSGYGKTYMALDNVEKRLDSVRDVVALREYLATLPYVDSSKIALHGASYGGFMVLACLAFHPGLWAAGIDVVGIANFITFLENTAPYRRSAREAEYGSLEHDRALLERISPIHAIDRIDAPLLLVHGANDPRVPLSEAEQVRDMLATAGQKAELLVYADEGHGIAKLANRLDAYPKMAAFLDAVLSRA